jgi:hypothetical protein
MAEQLHESSSNILIEILEHTPMNKVWLPSKQTNPALKRHRRGLSSIVQSDASIASSSSGANRSKGILAELTLSPNPIPS